MFDLKSETDTAPRSTGTSGLFPFLARAGEPDCLVTNRILNLAELLDKRLPVRGYIKQ